MNKIFLLFLILCLVLCPVLACAQDGTSSKPILYVTDDPTVCSDNRIRSNTTTGHFFQHLANNLGTDCTDITEEINTGVTGTGTTGTLTKFTGNEAIGDSHFSETSTAATLTLPLTVTEGTITTSKPALTHTVTWNGSGVTFSNITSNVTDTASAAGSLLLDLQVGGVSQFSVTKAGTLTALGSISSSGNLSAGSGSLIRFSTRTRMESPADGNLLLRNTAGSDFGSLQFGGTTSSFPALKRNGAGLSLRLADDSALGTLAVDGLASVTKITNTAAPIVLGDTALTGNQTQISIDDANNSVVLQFPDAGFFTAANVSGDLSFRMDGPGKSITLVADNGIVLADPIQGAFSVNSGSVHVSSNTITGTDPALDATQTWNSGGSTFVGIKLNITDTASAAASLLEDLQVGGVDKYTVNKSGNVVAAGSFKFGGGTTILKHLSATATLDFASLVAIGCEDLTIAITGAASGDTVALGVPNGSVVANGQFTAWISAADTATVRFCTFVSGNPTSGTFRIDAWQH